jgi:hypothetical protein
MFENVCI